METAQVRLMPSPEDVTMSLPLPGLECAWIEICTTPMVGVFNDSPSPQHITYVFQFGATFNEWEIADYQNATREVFSKLLDPTDFGHEELAAHLHIQADTGAGYIHVPATQEHIDALLQLYSAMCVRYEMQQCDSATDTLQ